MLRARLDGGWNDFAARRREEIACTLRILLVPGRRSSRCVAAWSNARGAQGTERDTHRYASMQSKGMSI